jgi:hypothetical protein
MLIDLGCSRTATDPRARSRGKFGDVDQLIDHRSPAPVTRSDAIKRRYGASCSTLFICRCGNITQESHKYTATASFGLMLLLSSTEMYHIFYQNLMISAIDNQGRGKWKITSLLPTSPRSVSLSTIISHQCNLEPLTVILITNRFYRQPFRLTIQQGHQDVTRFLPGCACDLRRLSALFDELSDLN